MFDEKNVPRDIKPEQKLKKKEYTLASGRGWPTPQKDFRQGKQDRTNGGSRNRNKGSPKGGPDNEGDSSDNNDEDNSSKLPSDEEDDVEGPNLPHPKEGTRHKPRTTHYNTPYIRVLAVELDAYRDRGAPQPTKHLRAMHEKYCLLIDRHVGQEVDHNNNVKAPRVPEPKTYDGEEDGLDMVQ